MEEKGRGCTFPSNIEGGRKYPQFCEITRIPKINSGNLDFLVKKIAIFT